ncbi:hypothetical protein NDU88_002559 [Pleurodeles waltl]|uniref:Uncharacterized protein n=1 Tax=Pleurodeles waltl TaxID=8319 RepID=A0AAV7VEQ6_PLEWA|nr:hypothetical protein NDU88_002559 [Pleurodeles waltl]
MVSGPVGEVPDNAALLAAISQFRNVLECKIGAMGSYVTLLRQDLRHVMERITETVTRVFVHANRVAKADILVGDYTPTAP